MGVNPVFVKKPAELVWPDPIIPSPTVESGGLDYIPLIIDARVYDVMQTTPVTPATKVNILMTQMSSRLESTIYLKREDLTPVFSFKCRGAYNKLVNLTRSESERGVCCVSAGNHAQGVALACSKLGIFILITRHQGHNHNAHVCSSNKN